MVHNLSLLLTQVINNNSPQIKTSFINSINEFKKKKQNEQDNLIRKRDLYHTNFILKRLNNDKNYYDYINNRSLLFKQWQKDKSLINLDKLINYKLPEIKEIPDIYTNSINPHYHKFYQDKK